MTIEKLERLGSYAIFFSGMLIAGFLALVLISVLFPTPRDATDPPNGRSGLILLTDHETGCQYLSVYRGGITPRSDDKGRHMCGTVR